MDRLNSFFLNSLRASLKGEVMQGPADLTPEEWASLIALSQSHHVLPLVYEAVRTLPELKDASFLPSLKRQIVQQVLMQTQKTCDFLELNKYLQAAGIRPLVVKGVICRELYPYPDHRVSGDEDVLISQEQIVLCHNVLSSFGMITEASPDQFTQAYEIPYRQKDGHLYIELHKHLFPPESGAYGDLNRFFDGAFDRAIVEYIQGIPVYTLEYTDHLFYLICHAFKHFLHSGFGIRQVCDIVMYANAYGERIDWQKVLDNCRAIHADLFAAALFRIGEKYLVFDPAKACYPLQWQSIDVDEVPMLYDLLSGGVYGNASMSRKHSSNITLDAVTSQKQGRKPGHALILSLFPSSEQLVNRYPYLEKRPYLLPVAWIDRICKFHKQSVHDRGNNASEALKIGNQRVALLKQYGIIE